MDFVSNIWSKSGLKKDDSAGSDGGAEPTDKANEGTTTTSTTTSTTTTNPATKGVGFVSNLIKSTFKKENQEGPTTTTDDTQDTDRKSSVTSNQEESSSLSPKGFVSNIFKNPFKSSGESRKGSTCSTGENVDKGTEEGQASAEGEAVTQKAVDSAKHFGSFLSSVANKAGQAVSATAKNVKHTVMSNTLLADFTKEQAEFVKEHGGHIEAADPPWTGCPNEEDVKAEIISLSQDKRNFVRNPPAGVDFPFTLSEALPVALAILKEDPNLSKMRYEVVPKLVNEETFWRNYFYRVSLLKESTSANSLGKGGKARGSTSSSEAEGPDEVSPTSEQPEFLRHEDSFQRQDSSATKSSKGSTKRQPSLPKRVDSKTDERRWEEEITKDLQEFEVVEGETNSIKDDELEKDLAELDAK